MTTKAAEFQAKQLKPFVGATIIDIGIDDLTYSGDENFVCIVIEKKGKQTLLWIQSDPEGNGPGYISPEPRVVG